ncbi:transporter [Chryseobacterium wanjuense]
MRVDGAPKVGYLLSQHQLVYLTKVQVLDGNLYFTSLMPLVKLSVDSESAPNPSVNPHVLGDLVLGSGIQWSDKKLFNHSFWHRAEFDVNLPTGSYNTDFAINPSGNLYSLSLYYTFSFFIPAS